MVSLRTLLEGPTPRPLLVVGTPIAAVVLITVFVFLGFPYDAFAPPLGHRLSAATGADVRIGGIDPRITIGGPGIAARDVIVLTPQGQPISIDPLLLRPAWSTSWLSLRPALHIDLASEIGELNGTLHVGESLGWSGEVVQIDLARLPVTLPNGISLSGLADADGELEMADGAVTGNLVFAARSGAITHPMIPIDIDFEELDGELVMGGDKLADLKHFALDGNTIRARAAGTVEQARRNGRNPLNLNVDIEIKNPGMASMLRSVGIDVDPQGKVSLRIGGSLQSPIVQ